MRADRLVSLVLLLRRHGRLSATALARELEVSKRTVLRDVDALSAAGVPIYAEHGRHGGFALLPGLGTELTGVNDDEAVAVLALGRTASAELLGLGPALVSALRKVVDALPDSQVTTAGAAATRMLVGAETDLLPRRLSPDVVAPTVLATVRRAVVAGRRLALQYTAREGEPAWRTVDPVGLVATGDRAYLLALRDGVDRTYRLSRIAAATELDAPAERPEEVDLDKLWRDRCQRFLADDHLDVVVRVAPHRHDTLLETAVSARPLEPTRAPDADGWRHLHVIYQDAWHAEWALWRLGPDAEVVSPPALRATLGARARAMAMAYGADQASGERCP